MEKPGKIRHCSPIQTASILDNNKSAVSHHDYAKFQEILNQHTLAPRSKLFLADGYDIERSYTNDLEIEEKLANGRRGILILYALPDTVALGLKEAEAYAIIWTAFRKSNNVLQLQWFITDRKPVLKMSKNRMNWVSYSQFTI